MNATLQCFYHVKALSENLINDKQIHDKMEITFCYKQLIEELTGCSNRQRFKINMQHCMADKKLKDYVEPNKFKDLIGEKNPLFKGIKACDSKDLIIFLLDNMDNELTMKNNGNDKKEIFYGTDPSQMEKESFKKYHNSIVADLFYGFQRSSMICTYCKKTDNTYSVINFLIFPLEKTYNSLNKNKNVINNNNNIQIQRNSIYYNIFNNNFNNNYNNDIYRNYYSNRNNYNGYYNYFNDLNLQKKDKKKLTLYQCFAEHQKEEKLSGQNRIYCNQCKNYRDAITKDEIYKAPNVLILIINRGKGNIFECDLDFPIELNISQFVKDNNSPKVYDLIGVISNLDEIGINNNFVAICKHFDVNWYLFNDAKVTQIREKDIHKGTPYILFYQNKNLKIKYRDEA
jgi:ubiquitin C-terminal hydrolase